MSASYQETTNLVAVRVGGGWVSEGKGSFHASTSDEAGITITERDFPDGRTEVIFVHAVSEHSIQEIAEYGGDIV
jgi:hypothetical protein